MDIVSPFPTYIFAKLRHRRKRRTVVHGPPSPPPPPPPPVFSQVVSVTAMGDDVTARVVFDRAVVYDGGDVSALDIGGGNPAGMASQIDATTIDFVFQGGNVEPDNDWWWDFPCDSITPTPDPGQSGLVE